MPKTKPQASEVASAAQEPAVVASPASKPPEPSQSRLYREDPGARLLFLCSALSRFERTDKERGHYHRQATLCPALPFWAPESQHAEFGALLGSLRNWAAWIGAGSAQPTLAPIDGPAARAMLLVLESSRDPISPKILDNLRLAAAQDAENGAPAPAPGALPRALGTELIVACAKALPEALERLHAQEASPELVAELLGRGRDALCNEFGMTPEQARAIEADKPLALALTRLAFFGGVDPRSALNCLDQDRSSQQDAEWLGQIYRPDLANPRSHYERQCAKALAELVAGVPALADGSALGIHMRLARVQGRFANGRPASHLRLALLALSTEGEPARAAREGLLRGTSTAEAGEPEASSWAKTSALGDFPMGDLGIDGGRRASGAPARGDAMREAFVGFLDIFRWRNPSGLLAGAHVQGAGPKALEAARDEAQAFAARAPQALAFAINELGRDVKCRRELTASLAERFSQGFAGLGAAPDLADLLPGFERAAAGADEGTPNWKAGGASADPMAKIAALAAELYGFDAPSGNALVGEAKRALSDKAGLTAAAWKAMAAHPALRDLFGRAARESLRPSQNPHGRRGPTMRQAEEIMRGADSLGDSSKARVSAIMGRESRSAPIEACAAALSASALLNLPTEEQAEMLSLMASPQASRLRAFMAGSLPCLPQGFSGAEASLTGAAACLPLMIEDARAVSALGAPMLKGIAARHRKNLAGVSAGLAVGNAKGIERAEESARAASCREFEDVLDCARAMPPGFWSRLDPKDPLAHARRMHEEWNQQLRARGVQNAPGSAKRWRSLVDRDRMDNMEARELVSARELFEEGSAMHHCVSSYSSQCAAGGSRIVSLGIDGARVSTLELSPMDSKGQRLPAVDFDDVASRRKVARWSVVQHRGKCNAHLSDRPSLVAFGETIAERASKAFASYTEKMADMKRMEAVRGPASSPLSPARI